MPPEDIHEKPLDEQLEIIRGHIEEYRLMNEDKVPFLARFQEFYTDMLTNSP